MTIDPNIPSPPPRGDGGGSNMLYFLVGGLVVLAGIFVFLYTNDYIPHGDTDGAAPATQTEPAQPVQPAPAPAAPAAPATGGGSTTQ
ncbi:MAG TPA: hypothetical protein VGF43_23940 [Dongiaceae bacterium]|jgi:hypothetical protein